MFEAVPEMRTMAIAVRAALMLLVLSGLPLHTDAATARERVRTVTEIFFPFQYVDPSTSRNGYVATIMHEVLAGAGLSTQVEYLTWTKAYKTAERTPNTLIFSMMRTPKRETTFHWIAPVAKIPPAAFFSAAERNLPTYPTIDGYKAHSVCAQEGTPPYDTLVKSGFEEGVNLFPLIDVAFSSMILDEALGPVDLDWYELLLTGRCEYRVTVPVSMWARIALAGRPKSAIVQHLDVSDPGGTSPLLYLSANSETDPDIIEAVSKSYERLNRSGRLREICETELPHYTEHCEIFAKPE